QLPRLDADAGERRLGDPVGAERPPAVAPAVPGDEVPARPGVDERVRLDVAPALGVVAGAVEEADPLAVAAGGREDAEALRIGGRAADAAGRDGDAPERRDAPAEVRREHLLELDERAERGLLDPVTEAP